jgi:hypothetical protein
MPAPFPPPPTAVPDAKGASISLTLPPPPPIDMRGMYSDDFVPPGAQRILPARRVTPKLHDTPQVKYPSMEPLVSPNGQMTIFSDSGESKKVMVHWLMLYHRGATRPASLYHTRNSYEVIWSTDNQRAVITDFVGDNRSTVTVVDARDDSTAPLVNLSPALLAYFPPEQLESPTFVRAHRWSDGAKLLVRGVGRLPVPPYDQFGYEVLVDVAHPDDPDGMVFVQGYLKKHVAE